MVTGFVILAIINIVGVSLLFYILDRLYRLIERFCEVNFGFMKLMLYLNNKKEKDE